MYSRFQSANSSLCQLNLDSGFQSLVRSQTPLSFIPNTTVYDSGFQKQNFTGSGIWGELKTATDRKPIGYQLATAKRGTVHQREFLQHDSHKATCSFRYERQGQTRITPGLAARQLNSMGLPCKKHVLFEVFSDGAKILSQDTMGDVWHWIPALKSTVEMIIQLKVLLVS